MAWYADLELCDYWGESAASRLRVVGGLERDKPYMIGEVSEAFFARLCKLLLSPWNPVYPAGGQPCQLCRFTGGAETAFHGLPVKAYSDASLFVPGAGVLYVTPISIAHFIDAHGYQPPEEFCAAVMACTKMRSPAYFKALLANGGRELMQAGSSV